MSLPSGGFRVKMRCPQQKQRNNKPGLHTGRTEQNAQQPDMADMHRDAMPPGRDSKGDA